MKITYAEEKDIAAIAAAEAACFPPAEAATEQEFVERIKAITSGCCTTPTS